MIDSLSSSSFLLDKIPTSLSTKHLNKLSSGNSALLCNKTFISKNKIEVNQKNNSLHQTSVSVKVLSTFKRKMTKIKERVKDNLSKSRFHELSDMMKSKPSQELTQNLRRLMDRDLKKHTKSSLIDLFETKVKERINASNKILAKLRNDNISIGQNIIFAVLGMDLRTIEAHIDACGNDFKRAVIVNTRDQYMRTCLHYACSLGQLGSIEMMMMVGADSRLKDIYGRTPLHYAAIQDKKEVAELIKLLFHKSCKINEGVSENTDYRTVARLLKYKKLKRMAKVPKPQVYSVKNIPKTVCYLDYSLADKEVQRHIDRMNAADSKEQSRKVEPATFEELLNNRDELGRTPLHLAALCDKIALIRILLDFGANPDIKDINSSRPLELSSSRLASSVLLSRMKNPKKINIEKNLIITTETDISGLITKDLLLMDEKRLNSFLTEELQENYLHISVKSKNIDAVQILLQRNFRPSQCNKYMWNAIHMAVKANSLKILALLVKGLEDVDKEKGFKFQKPWLHDSWVGLDATTAEKYSVLHLAILHGDIEMLSWIIDTLKKREQSIQSKLAPEHFLRLQYTKLSDHLEISAKKMNTPLLLSVKTENINAASLLINAGCNLYSRNEKLQNALHIASIQGNKKLVELLIRADSDFNRLRIEKDMKDRTPKDFDITGRLSTSYYHIWDYSRLGNINRIKIVLITKEFNINEQTPKKKQCSLHVAIEFKQLECIRTLVLMGADLHIKNANGQTPLEMAISNEEYQFESNVIKLLRGEGISPGIINLRPELRIMMHKEKKRKKLRCKDINDSFIIPKFSGKHSKEKIERETEEYWFEIRNKIIEKGVTISEIFDMMDSNKDRALTFVEFHGLVIWLGVNLKLDEIQKLAMIADKNQNGLIEYEELVNRLQDLLYKEKMRRMTLQFLSKQVPSSNMHA